MAHEHQFFISLVAGSAAGTSVDTILFPLDTIKTRLQSPKGFWESGGFKGVYRGIVPAFIGSAPSAAAFFCTYDSMKHLMAAFTGDPNNPMIHMTAASIGEMAACIVRVPVEIVKQRRQVGSKRAGNIIGQILKLEGFPGFYRGYFSTIMREIPFSIIQFPLWEFLKLQVSLQNDGICSPWESSVCGAVAGGIAAALTTPLDVAKTRIMLADVASVESKGNIVPVWKIIYGQQGVRGLFAGVVPRTLWISLGGAIFFGAYECVKDLLIAAL